MFQAQIYPYGLCEVRRINQVFIEGEGWSNTGASMHSPKHASRFIAHGAENFNVTLAYDKDLGDTCVRLTVDADVSAKELEKMTVV